MTEQAENYNDTQNPKVERDLGVIYNEIHEATEERLGQIRREGFQMGHFFVVNRVFEVRAERAIGEGEDLKPFLRAMTYSDYEEAEKIASKYGVEGRLTEVEAEVGFLSAVENEREGSANDFLYETEDEYVKGGFVKGLIDGEYNIAERLLMEGVGREDSAEKFLEGIEDNLLLYGFVNGVNSDTYSMATELLGEMKRRKDPEEDFLNGISDEGVIYCLKKVVNDKQYKIVFMLS